MSRRDVFVFPDGGEEEEAAAAGEDRLLAASQHCGQGGHQEIRREVPQEEGRYHGNNLFFILGEGTMLFRLFLCLLHSNRSNY